MRGANSSGPGSDEQLPSKTLVKYKSQSVQPSSANSRIHPNLETSRVDAKLGPKKSETQGQGGKGGEKKGLKQGGQEAGLPLYLCF